MEAGAPVQVTVAVVSWNTRELLEECLESLHPEVAAGRAEVWVVDNASTDGSAESVSSRYAWAKLIRSEENIGFGPAVNLVATRTGTPWVAPANADIRLEPGALEALLDAGRRERSAAIIAPRLVLDDGTTQHSVYSFPTIRFTLLFNLGIASATDRLADRFALEGRWDPERARLVDWAIGAFVLVRRDAWEAVGGFDAQQWMYAEDLDLGWRVARAGWKTFYEPRAIVHHHASAATSQAWGDDRTERWTRSTYAWMMRRFGPVRTRLVAVINIAGAAARALALTPLALISSERWGWRRELFKRWARLHSIGLASARRLLDHR
jgi:N-acetylglucosaminyl-diphospho-decaprenol L-rhamnosyltransferase